MPNEIYEQMNKYYSDIIDDKFNNDLYSREDRQKELTEIKDRLKTIFSYGTILELAGGGGYWTHALLDNARQVITIDQNIDALEEEFKGTNYHVTIRKVDLLDEVSIQKEIQGHHFTGCFASCWISHILREDLYSYLDNLIKALLPSMKDNLSICFIDSKIHSGNKDVFEYGEDHKLVGNQYQIRTMKNGDRVEIVKNFYELYDWVNIIDSCKCKIVEYREWDIYYLVKFTLR